MPVYVFYGEEGYLLQRELKQMRKAVINPDMAALSHKVIEQPSIGQLLEVLGTVTFSLGGESLYEIHEFVSLHKAAEDASEKAQLEALKELIDGTEPSRHLLFINKKIDRKVGFAKWITANKGTMIREFKKLEFWKTDEAVQVIMQDAKQKGIQLTGQAATLLVENMGVDLQLLTNEVEKLSVYAANRGITPQDVQALSNHHDNTFEMLNQWVNGQNRGEVFVILDEILLRQHPVQLYALCQTYLNNLYRLKLWASLGIPEAEMADRLKKHPFKIKKDLQDSKRVPLERVAKLKEQLIQLEWQAKTGQINDRLGLEMLLSQ